MTFRIVPLSAISLLSGSFLYGASAALPHNMQQFLGEYCVRCHGPEAQKADFRLDQLGISETTADAESWRLILDTIQLGDMPPADEPQPELAQIESAAEWIDSELRRARNALRGNVGEVVFRRLNKVEYRNTLIDLFEIYSDLTTGFPDDATYHGFDNIGAILSLSTAQMTAYLEAADQILRRATNTGPKPGERSGSYDLVAANERAWDLQRRQLERRIQTYNTLTPLEQRRTDEMKARMATDPHDGWIYPVFENGSLRAPMPGENAKSMVLQVNDVGGVHAINSGRFLRASTPGIYQLAFSAYAIPQGNRYPSLEVYTRTSGRDAIETPFKTISVLNTTPERYVFDIYLEPNETVGIRLINGMRRRNRGNLLEVNGPMAGLFDISKKGPMINEWPTRGHRTLYGDYDLTHSDVLTVRGIIGTAASNLFRRPATAETIDDYFGFYRELSEKYNHADALRNTLRAMLVSPHFLYRVEYQGQVDEFALASRLSYFLWRSTPDRELLSLASQNRLSDRATRHAQIERLLNDPKAERFITDFTRVWLNTSHVGVMTPDENLYPEWDDRLRRAMVGESEGFFREMLTKNEPIANFIDSDWTVLNERLARHYGIEGVRGDEFRRVSLDRSKTVRGGLLTQGTFLNVTANGTTTSPIIRGVWMLEKFLGTPTPAPPSDVPVIEPDIRGATNVKEQLALHSAIPQCASCHQRIDPLGIAFENFDAIGGWRENYRAINENRANRREPSWRDGPQVDTKATHPTMGQFTTFSEFREILKKNEHLVLNNLASLMVSYGLGRTITFADRESIEGIVNATRNHGSGLRTLVQAVAMSDLFTNP